uniref:Uncharacterized protein n=1 Tax=Oryza meridionalis TaxID=40149 RepID=A0A0E0D343_9ORYZ
MAATKTVDDESVESYVTQMMHGPLVFEENDGGGEADAVGKEGVQVWSSQYFPDDPLVVVADVVPHASSRPSPPARVTSASATAVRRHPRWCRGMCC